MERLFAERVVENGKARRADIAQTILAKAGVPKPAWWNMDNTADDDDSMFAGFTARRAGYRPVVVDDYGFSDSASFTQEEAPRGGREPGEGRATTTTIVSQQVLNTKAQTIDPSAKKVPRSLFRLSRLTIPGNLRCEIRRVYPGLDRHPAYWRMFAYICYGTSWDEHSRLPLAHWRTIAEIEGVEPDHHYNSTVFVERFSHDVFPVHLSGYNASEGRARVIESIEFDDGIRRLIVGDLMSAWSAEGRVYLTTGKAYTKKVQKAIRDEERDAVMSLAADAGCDEERNLLEYLNRLPSNRFEKAVQRNWDEAMAVVSRIESDLVAEQQFRILRLIRDQPVPFYAPSERERTVRIFARNSIFNLKSNVRAVLCQDWTGFDLRSAQLAICAADWNVPEVQEFLGRGEKIWPTLFDWFGSSDANPALMDEMKAMFKIGLYGVIFGAGRERIVQEFEEFGGTTQDAQHFLAHPIIKAMWKARTARVRQITNDSGAMNCFGKWIECPIGDDSRLDAPSVLAQLAQARELQLLYPVVELAKTTDEFAIVLWIHDGFYVDFKDASKKGRWIKRITEAVNNKAIALGIHTVLDPK